jgi:hypothetical protein
VELFVLECASDTVDADSEEAAHFVVVDAEALPGLVTITFKILCGRSGKRYKRRGRAIERNSVLENLQHLRTAGFGRLRPTPKGYRDVRRREE